MTPRRQLMLQGEAAVARGDLAAADRITAALDALAGKKRSGRPALPPEQRSDKTPRSIRLDPVRWEKLKRLGPEWLERAIDGAQDER